MEMYLRDVITITGCQGDWSPCRCDPSSLHCFRDSTQDGGTRRGGERNIREGGTLRRRGGYLGRGEALAAPAELLFLSANS